MEGLSLKAYRDGLRLDDYAIGYGHNNRSGLLPYVVKGMSITKEKAYEILLHDLPILVEAPLNRSVHIQLLQHQFDALALLLYGKGQTWFRKSNLLAVLNRGDWRAAYYEMLTAHSLAQYLMWPGLKRRDLYQAKLFSGEIKT